MLVVKNPRAHYLKIQFVPHREHITSPQQGPTGYCCLGKQSRFIVRNITEHTDTLCGQNAVHINSVRTSQETHYVSATKPNRLMLFRETVAVYCENRTEHTDTLCGQNAEFQFLLLKGEGGGPP
jgi:hypothetical protein